MHVGLIRVLFLCVSLSAVWALGLLFSVIIFPLVPVRPLGVTKSFIVSARDWGSVVLTPSGTVDFF